MTEYGVTRKGFERKGLSVILEEVASDIEAALGRNINLTDASPLGRIHGILCARESAAWELLQYVYDSQYPDTARGISLDHAVELTGTQRLKPQKSRIPNGIGYGKPQARFEAGTLTVFLRSNPQARFVNVTPLVIDQPAKDAVYTIRFSALPKHGTFKIRLDTEATAPIPGDVSMTNFSKAFVDAVAPLANGVKLTSLDLLTAKIVFSVPMTGSNTYLALRIEPADCTTLKPATNLNTDVITVQIDGKPGNAAFGVVEMESERVGDWPVDEGLLTEIATPKAGLDAFTNHVSGATVGRFFEPDSKLKLRRLGELQLFGAATVNAIASKLSGLVDSVSVFENANSVDGDDGQPPHSVEIVIEGGINDEEIGLTIWNNMSAGITTWSPASYRTTVKVRDSQGFEHMVFFTRPKKVVVSVNVEIKAINKDLFPADRAADLIKTAISTVRKFKRGESVVARPYLEASLVDTPGITDLSISVFKDGEPPGPVASMGKRDIAILPAEAVKVVIDPPPSSASGATT